MPGQPVDAVTLEQAGLAMHRLAEFETPERHAIRCVFEAARAGGPVDDDHLQMARSALQRHSLT